MSREALSLDISRLVSRVVSGEPIDTTERGAALAAKYPDLGMSGALIGQAIERAAGMVGMIRNAPEPTKQPPPRATKTPTASRSTAGNGQTANGQAFNGQAVNGHAANGHAANDHQPSAATSALGALPVAAQSIDGDLAAAIDAEIGNLVTGHRARPMAPAKPKGDMPVATSDVPAARTSDVTCATQTAPARADSEMLVRPTPPQAPSAAKEPAMTEPPQASIFSSFRRAFFRT